LVRSLQVSQPLAAGKLYQHLAYGPTGIIAAAWEGHVHLLSAASGELLERIDAHDGPITCMQWCPRLWPIGERGAQVAVLATCSRDKRVRLWRTPA
jgi:WD40 repeat protein